MKQNELFSNLDPIVQKMKDHTKDFKYRNNLPDELSQFERCWLWHEYFHKIQFTREEFINHMRSMVKNEGKKDKRPKN